MYTKETVQMTLEVRTPVVRCDGCAAAIEVRVQQINRRYPMSKDDDQVPFEVFNYSAMGVQRLNVGNRSLDVCDGCVEALARGEAINFVPAGT